MSQMYDKCMQHFQNLQSELNKLRIDILRAAMNSKEGHIPSAFSILDILYCIFIDTEGKKNSKDRNFKFILSKGHASLALYAVLARANYINETWITGFGQFNSLFGGHPDRTKVQGVLASTGSLGHGLPMGVGLAMAQRALGVGDKVFVLIGDGELNEGSNWESFMIANHHMLGNLTVIIDYNLSSHRAVRQENLSEKLTSFGFSTSSINGHDHNEIFFALFEKNDNFPKAVIANTIKGNGLSDMENNPAWHHAIPSNEQYLAFMKELQK